VKKAIPLVIICISVVLSACVKQQSYPPYPIVTMQGVSRTTDSGYFASGLGTDSIEITLGFTDGEGGIGPVGGNTDTLQPIPCTNHSYDPDIIGDPNWNVFLYSYHAPSISTDSCISFLATAYVPDNPKDVSIKGTIQIKTSLECPPTGNYDTVYFSCFIKDRAGKVSNRVRTPQIYIFCQ